MREGPRRCAPREGPARFAHRWGTLRLSIANFQLPTLKEMPRTSWVKVAATFTPETRWELGVFGRWELSTVNGERSETTPHRGPTGERSEPAC
jgi:hypothetical protein